MMDDSRMEIITRTITPDLEAPSNTANINSSLVAGRNKTVSGAVSVASDTFPERSNCMVHTGGFLFVVRQIIRFIASIIPLINIGADILTSILYTTIANDQELAKKSHKFNETDYHTFQNTHFDIIVIVLLLFSARAYFICFSATADHSTLFFVDYDVVRNMYRLIPVCGAPLASFIEDEDYRDDC